LLPVTNQLVQNALRPGSFFRQHAQEKQLGTSVPHSGGSRRSHCPQRLPKVHLHEDRGLARSEADPSEETPPQSGSGEGLLDFEAMEARAGTCHIYLAESSVSLQVRGLAKQLDMSVEEVQRWVELRGAQDKPSVLTRFCESLWRGCYYGGAWTAAVTIVWDKPWFWDLDQCWTNWDQRGTSDVWWYVMCSWTFYWSELVVLHLNAKKKDFYPTLIHHVTSIILLYFAWNSNLSRIFMVGFVLIDCSDIPLEVSKMTLYLGHDKVSRVAYFTFVFVWIVTRLGYLPFWAVKSYVQDAPRILPFLRDYSFYYIIMILIFVLLILNCIWTFFVLKVARDILFTEKPFRDSRSDSSDN
jgi:hypothetical protein